MRPTRPGRALAVAELAKHLVERVELVEEGGWAPTSVGEGGGRGNLSPSQPHLLQGLEESGR